MVNKLFIAALVTALNTPASIKAEAKSEDRKFELSAGYSFLSRDSGTNSVTDSSFKLKSDYALKPGLLTVGFDFSRDIVRRKQTDEDGVETKKGYETNMFGPNLRLKHKPVEVRLSAQFGKDPQIFETTGKKSTSAAFNFGGELSLSEELALIGGFAQRFDLDSDNNASSFYGGIKKHLDPRNSFYLAIANSRNDFYGNNTTYGVAGYLARNDNLIVKLEGMAGQRVGGGLKLGMPLGSKLDLILEGMLVKEKDSKTVTSGTAAGYLVFTP